MHDDTKQALESGLFDTRTRTGCQAVTYDGKLLDYPYTHEEWLTTCFQLWDKIHAVAEGKLKPSWDMLPFRSEKDYFCNSFQTSLQLWLLAINRLSSEKLKYQAYDRIYHGCDLFEVNDFIRKEHPRKNNNLTSVCTKILPHEHNLGVLKKLGVEHSTKLCGVPVYKNCRTIRISKNNQEFPAIFPNGSSVEEHHEFILENVLKWSKSGAISCLGEVNSDSDLKLQAGDHFFSASIFVVVTSKPRLIFNGHPLKCIERFKKSCVLDSIPEVLKLIRKNDILLKYDDSSGFHQLPLSGFSKNLACFEFDGLRFRFNCSPFGIPIIPSHFQGANSVPINYARYLGCICFLYLDDRLTLNRNFNRSGAPPSAWIVCALQIALGGFINREKSTFKCSKIIEFLGFIINTFDETLSIPKKKWRKFTFEGRNILRQSKIYYKIPEKFRGKCCSFAYVAPMMRLYIRNQTRWITEAYKGIGMDDGFKTLNEDIKNEIRNWVNRKNITTKRKWSKMSYERVRIIKDPNLEHNDLVIATDASGFAGGIHVNGSETTFYWKDSDFSKAIHVKEALAVKAALIQYKSQLDGKTVLLEVDNSAVVSSFQFGSRIKELDDIIRECAEIAIKNNFNIQIIWVPTKEQKADEPSRLITNAEAELSPVVVSKLESLIEANFTLDLCATRYNAKTRRFISREFDCEAIHINFFTKFSFENEVIYAFPPQTILTETFLHLQKFAKNQIWALIVRSGWTIPSWYSEISSKKNFLFVEIDNDDSFNILVPSTEGMKPDRSPKKTWSFIHFPYNLARHRFLTIFDS